MKAYQRKHNLYSRYFLGEVSRLTSEFVAENIHDYLLWKKDLKLWVDKNCSAQDIKEVLKSYEQCKRPKTSAAKSKTVADLNAIAKTSVNQE